MMLRLLSWTAFGSNWVIVSIATAGPNPIMVSPIVHPSSLQLHLDDDIMSSFGGSVISPDAWWEWDTGAATDNFRLSLTDCDGVGSDCAALYWNTGTDDAVMSGDLEIGGILTVAPYTRHIDVAVDAATVGVTAPTVVSIGTFRCLQFSQAQSGETANVEFEMRNDWNGTSDLEMGVYWYSESGDALADGETVQWDMTYRCIDEGEPYDNGTATTVSVVHTQSGAGTDKEQYRTDATWDYDDADQPLSAGDIVGIEIDLNEGATSYSGDPILCIVEAEYQSIRLSNH